ncbi:MAG: M1 family metallopeptidase [Chitinophagaceae bacterium]
MNKYTFLFVALLFLQFTSQAQLLQKKQTFTHADTLRGSITPERAWWDVLRYDITVKPDYETKTITAKNIIQFKVVKNIYTDTMQIDLQQPMIIDSIISENKKMNFIKADTNIWYVSIPKQNFSSINSINIYYHGKPREAIKPPWDGGWIWTKDSLGRPWISVACQGLGASVWYPCKDHQSDEPDNGASLTIIVPDSLVAVGNGKLQFKKNDNDGTTTYQWQVKNPINNYNIIPYIGKYVNFSETYNGAKGNLAVNYWVLDYNLQKAKQHLAPDVRRMLKAFEYWFGPYPFYEDGYKIVDAPHLGMEHQSAIAYGNHYLNGYHGEDLSGSGWGMKWDFIVVHESAHEWFGNNITTKDLADMWVHEAFANYSETLFTEYYYGKKAANEYNVGIRKNIRNDEPIIGPYNVNKEGSGDEYYKGGNLLQLIRHSINDDEKFRQILRGLTKTFYHQTVTTKQIENYISEHAGFDYSKVFDQYLRTTQIPQLEMYFSDDKKKIFYRWTNCVKGFNLPLAIWNDNSKIKIFPAEDWKSSAITASQQSLFNPILIEDLYYITAKMVK